MLNRKLIGAGAVLSFLAVALGAFGKHALSASLSPKALEIFETANRYHASHGIGVILLAVIACQLKEPRLDKAGWLIVAGVTVFSGSLYVLALTGVTWLGAITPIGGFLLLYGWGLLCWVTLSPRPQALSQ